jgi:murein DD-endopeptidase MepM/ murein hydrolase activator NlpD
MAVSDFVLPGKDNLIFHSTSKKDLTKYNSYFRIKLKYLSMSKFPNILHRITFLLMRYRRLFHTSKCLRCRFSLLPAIILPGFLSARAPYTDTGTNPGVNGNLTAWTDTLHLANPFDFRMQLSGAFCDLRPDHFHAGIDIRTNGSEGHALHAVRGGYVERISVSPWGYGLAVYIAHPDDSIITVYGHLQRFNRRLTDSVKEKQYNNESYTVDFNFNPEVIPVKQGEIIGYSGNSGSSGGPHLHFEVRDMQNNEPIDPLVFYKPYIPDMRKPLVRGLKIYPIEGKGMVNGSNSTQNIEFKLDKNDQPLIVTTVEAWGEIGLGIRAVDRMDGTGFSYGIKDVLQTVDSVETYRSYADRFSFEESKYINSYIDYEEWYNSRTFYIKTFVEPGCNLRFTASRHSGIITINEERIYHVNIKLTDLYGNACNVLIKIQGKKHEITPPDTVGAKTARWYDDNVFGSKNISLTIPRNSLYSNVYIHYTSSDPYDTLPGGNALSSNTSPLYHTPVSQPYYSAVHTLHKSPVPLYKPAQLSIHTNRMPEHASTEQLGIVRINTLTGNISWIGGAYRDGWMDTEINVLGTYAVMCDTIPPVITPVDPDKWHERKQIKIRITDNMSGIAMYRGEIDGKYALFEFDGKKAALSYDFDDERLHPGYHRLKLTVTDQRGNKSEYKYFFTW